MKVDFITKLHLLISKWYIINSFPIISIYFNILIFSLMLVLSNIAHYWIIKNSPIIVSCISIKLLLGKIVVIIQDIVRPTIGKASSIVCLLLI